MAADQNSIKHCFQLLKNSDPQLYERLIRLCDQYTHDLMEATVTAPQDQILVAQGRAQQAIKFMRLMTEMPVNPKPTA